MREVNLGIQNELIEEVKVKSIAPVATVSFVSQTFDFRRLRNFYDDVKKQLSTKYKEQEDGIDKDVASFRIDDIGTCISIRKFKFSRQILSDGKAFIYFGGTVQALIEFTDILEELKIISDNDKEKIITAYKQARYETSLMYEHSSLIGLCINKLINNIDFDEFANKGSDEYFKPIEEHYKKFSGHIFWKEKAKVKELIDLRVKVKEINQIEIAQYVPNKK